MRLQPRLLADHHVSVLKKVMSSRTAWLEKHFFCGPNVGDFFQKKMRSFKSSRAVGLCAPPMNAVSPLPDHPFCKNDWLGGNGAKR